MLKIKRVLLSIFLILLIASVAKSKEEDTTFNKSILGSEVIVEGIVQQQVELPMKETPIYVGQIEIHSPLAFGTVQKNYLTVTKVFKGNIVEGSSIMIYIYPRIHKKIVQLSSTKKYILFLKPKEDQQGYTIAEGGKTHWLIFDYNGVQKLKSWQQYNCYRNADAYIDYEIFIRELGLNAIDVAAE